MFKFSISISSMTVIKSGILYDKKLEIQKYMTSVLFSNKEVSLLYSLRSRSVDCKANFKQKYLNKSLLCTLCNEVLDDQKHLLSCKILLKNLKTIEISSEIKYEDIFADDEKKQKNITALYMKLIRMKNAVHPCFRASRISQFVQSSMPHRRENNSHPTI